MRPRSRLSAVIVVLAVAACSEPPNAPAKMDPTDAGIPEASYRPRSGEEGYRIRPDAIRTGFITGRNGLPREITYEVYGEVAVWEGDIMLGPAARVPATREALERMIQQRRRADTPNGVVIDGAGFRWANGIVPYEINGAGLNARVTAAIAWVEEATAGIDLVPRNGEADYIRFTTGSGCSSPIGKQGGMQDIILASDCSTGNAAHEIIHSLGLFHEHTRCDRDTYVTINTANIESGKEGNFDKNCDDATDYFDYDEGSIMHYGPFFFSKNDQPTIVSKRDRDDEMGQRDALGPTDIETLNLLYGAFNDAPTAAIAPLAASYPEGTPVNFDGSGSSDADDAVLTYAWTFGDGTCTGGTPPAACSQQSPSHTYADNGSYPVTLTVSDGYLTDVANATATITNVDPVVSAGSDATVNEGSLYTGSGSFVDPGAADTWTATVNYGDGSGTQALTLSGTRTFSLSHTYVDNGEYTVTVTVTDDDSGSGSDDLKVTVLNVAPIVEAGPDASVTSGQVFDFSGSFSDPGVNDAPWGWEIDWGFGAKTTGSTNDQSAAITASRQVCVAGEYAVKLSVTDKDGGTGSDFMTLTVPYFAVTLDISPGGTPNPINIGRRGQWSIAILSTPTFDATGVDPATVVLGDESGVDTPVAQRNNGTWYASFEDVNKDGLPDLVVKFDVPTLTANGDVTAATTNVVLRGFLNDGCTNVRGEGPVIVRPG